MFGPILVSFWFHFGSLGVHGLPFWCQNRTPLKDGHQNGAQKLPGTSLLALWSPQGLPKCPQDLMFGDFGNPKDDFLRKLEPIIVYFSSSNTMWPRMPTDYRTPTKIKQTNSAPETFIRSRVGGSGVSP